MTQFLIFLVIFSLLISPSLSEKCHKSDKVALLNIAKALNNPYRLIQWTPDTDCCDWYAITCDERTHRVTEIDISDADFNLPIPGDAIAGIPNLQRLTFHTTNVIGQIPQSLTKLTNLRLLDLRYNNLTGPVPSFLSQFRSLEYLGLSFNKLTGSIPPSLSQLTNLTVINLDRNQLTGSIPKSFGEFKSQVIYLYLSDNQLSGKIPANMGNARFNYIDMQRNKLEGDISFMYGRKKTIQNVYLSRNMLEFDFSKFEFPENLVNLDLNHNKIRGSLPRDLVHFKDLISLNVSYNRLCGKIPVGGRLQEFDSTAYFHNRCLCGAPLPACK